MESQAVDRDHFQEQSMVRILELKQVLYMEFMLNSTRLFSNKERSMSVYRVFISSISFKMQDIVSWSDSCGLLLSWLKCKTLW